MDIHGYATDTAHTWEAPNRLFKRHILGSFQELSQRCSFTAFVRLFRTKRISNMIETHAATEIERGGARLEEPCWDVCGSTEKQDSLSLPSVCSVERELRLS